MTRRFRVMLAMVMGALLSVAALMGAGRLLAETLASDTVPEIVNYQGYLTDAGGNPISSTVTLQFGIWDASSGGSQVWSETHNNVTVSGGYFSVLLGSQGTPLTPSVFSNTSRYLEVTYGATVFARQRFSSVPYALVAAKASTAITSTYATSSTYAMNAKYATTSTYATGSTYAMTATYALNAPSGSGGVAWSHVVVVAKSGGDYTTVTDAMNAITPSSADRYLVLVMPGVYEEQVVLKPYVHLKGAGVVNTMITSAANTNNLNDDAAVTMMVPADSQVSDLRVRNNAATNDSVALKVDNGNIQTILNNVQIKATGAGGDQHIGLYLDSGSVTLSHIDVEVNGGTGNNWGIYSLASTYLIHDSNVEATTTNSAGLRFNGGGASVDDSVISGANGSNGQGINTSGGAGTEVYIDRSTIEGDSGTGSSIISTDNYDFFAGASKLVGDVDVFAPATFSCSSSYDGNYNDLCP